MAVNLNLLVCVCFIVFNVFNSNHYASAASETRQLWNATWTDKLKRDLLYQYDKFARPSNHTNTTTVSINLTVRHVQMDEMRSVMTVHGWVKMAWTDDKLKWNESDYGGLSVVHLADHEIWQPDVVLYNSAEGSMVDHYGNTHCLAHPDGTVIWVPPSQFTVFCDLDLTYWPYDKQTCMLRVGSWTYDGEQLDLQLDSHGPNVDLVESNSEWRVADVTQKRNVVYYSCCSEPYIDVMYNVSLRRVSPSYSAVVITPATVVVLLTLCTFWLPPLATEKLYTACCAALIICLFLLYFATRLPAMASHTPLVVLFYSSSLYLVSGSLVLTVVVMNVARRASTIPAPWILRVTLQGLPGRLLCLGLAESRGCLKEGGSGGEELRERSSIDEQQLGLASNAQGEETSSTTYAYDLPPAPAPAHHHHHHHHHWILLAAAIDRIAFLLYSLIFIILAAVYAV